MQEGSTGNLFNLNEVQLFAAVTKLALLYDLILEAIMNVYEAIKLHHLKQQSINVIVMYKEPERRRKFAKKYMCRAATWMVVLLSGAIALNFIFAKVDCKDG